MSEPRNFDTEYNLADKPGVSFILGGLEFHTKSVVPPSVFLKTTRGFDFAVDLIREALVPEERDIFNKMLEDPDSGLSVTQVDGVGLWLMGELTESPTDAPDSSGSGGATTSSE